VGRRDSGTEGQWDGRCQARSSQADDISPIRLPCITPHVLLLVVWRLWFLVDHQSRSFNIPKGFEIEAQGRAAHPGKANDHPHVTPKAL
jgi:hypothetical protein